MLEELPITIYLLIQGGRVVDNCSAFRCLRLYDIDSHAGFKIAVGCKNEWGEKEVIGVIVDVASLAGCKIWSVTPVTHGCSPYTIHTNDTPGDFVRHRLSLMIGGGHLDLANLPPTLTIKPATS